MRGYTLYNVSDPVNPQDVTTKEHAVKVVNNVGKYVDEKNAYIKSEVDDFTKLFDHVNKTIDERPHIIAVHASYHGFLIKDEFQFSFGGSTINPNDSSGFLIPHSGRIKKDKIKNPV